MSDCDDNGFMLGMFVMVCVGLVLGTMFGDVIGYSNGTIDTQDEALKAKVGEYYIDKNNDKRFRFLRK